jgi:hypothetical protein
MSSPVVALEEIVLVAPLGVRFWDVSLGARAGAGLDVRIWPVAIRELETVGVEGPGGVYSFHHLPGMRAVEDGAGDAAYWAAQTPRFPFVLQVTDPQSRYLPFTLPVLLPQRGIFGLRMSPLARGIPDDTWFPLFSSPTRVFAAKAMLRAQIAELATDRPAAWAVVEARAGMNTQVLGLADERGVVSMPIEWPEPEDFGLGSPIGGVPRQWAQQRWTVDFTIYYARVGSKGAYPDLEAALSQLPAMAWADRTAASDLRSAELVFGQDLTLRSLDHPGGRELPYLYVTPAGSPLI